MKTMNVKRLLVFFALLMGLSSCNRGVEAPYEIAYLYVGKAEGWNFFSQGDVKLCLSDDLELYNLGSDQVEFAFVKDLVYRIQMINKIPEHGWTETIERVNLQDGYVGRLLLDDGSYEYCRFYIYNIDYDINAEQYVLFKYQSEFVGK